MRKSKRPGILFLTQGNTDHSSSRIRVIQYFPYLKKKGFHLIWIPRIPVKKHSLSGKYLVFPVIKRLNILRVFFAIFLCQYKVLFVQRLFIPAWCLILAHKRGKKIIFDFDDAIYYPSEDSEEFTKTRNMVFYADRVITSSPVLLKWVMKLNTNGVVITSPVDTDLIRPGTRENQVITIGWIGSEWTSKYLEPLEEVFKLLQEKYKIHFLFVGAKNNILPGISKTMINWSLEKEAELLTQMDIGIMPLNDGEFEKGKGGYKIFQYMSAGIPVIASPVGINSEIVEHGKTGFLCTAMNEWYKCLILLIKDKYLREKMGNLSRHLALEKYGLSACSMQLLNLMEDLIAIENPQAGNG
jgi:glycosyltransferase involved in cell wall biosynthesis